MKGYGKFLDGIEKIEKLFLAVTVAIMIIVITYQVILRYVFLRPMRGVRNWQGICLSMMLW